MWTHIVSREITLNDVDSVQLAFDKEVEVVYSPKWLKENPRGQKGLARSSRLWIMENIHLT